MMSYNELISVIFKPYMEKMIRREEYLIALISTGIQEESLRELRDFLIKEITGSHSFSSISCEFYKQILSEEINTAKEILAKTYN